MKMKHLLLQEDVTHGTLSIKWPHQLSKKLAKLLLESLYGIACLWKTLPAYNNSNLHLMLMVVDEDQKQTKNQEQDLHLLYFVLNQQSLNDQELLAQVRNGDPLRNQ